MSSLSNYQSLRVVVIGSYNTDLVIWCDAIPVRGQSILGGDFEMFSGGRGANCAVAAARSGCQVKFVGAHGPDTFGKMALDRLAREGIDITDFVELPLSKTGVAMIFQERKTASHAALVSNSANTDFSAALIKKVEPDIRESDLVFTQFEISSSVLSEIYRICHQHKKHLVVHAAPVQAPVSFPKSSYYLLVADDFEAFLLAGYNDLDASIRELHEQGVQNVIIKRGHHSLIFSDGKACRVQPIPVAPFVQDAGAVECLTAWAGIALANTGDLAYATYIGAQAMAFSFSRHGAEDSMPYASELSLGPTSPSFPQPHSPHRPNGVRH
ncbi:MAG TPA: PfkB family carbohydrate kinase [Chthoniobacterales bacterium]|nr:PfkB family carbohydrate kinase [Chthoniobacterales bacterium]